LFTVIVKLCCEPGQLFAVGVTVIVAVTGDAVLFVAVKEVMSPVPEAPSPMDVVLFAQLYVVPLTLPLKLTVAVEAPLHNVWSTGSLTVGVGFTVMVNV
jgi:hypothetical protein